MLIYIMLIPSFKTKTKQDKKYYSIQSEILLLNKIIMKLHLFDNVTKTQNVFSPKDGNKVKWSCCIQTVNDVFHMGHTRCYIIYDVIRRVLSTHFGFEVDYNMNIAEYHDINELAFFTCLKSLDISMPKSITHDLNHILNEKVDIYTTDDMQLFNHDNEMAYNFCVLQSGRLMSSYGFQMSNSIYDGIFLKDVLKSYTVRIIRLAFVLQSWQDDLTYEPKIFNYALHYERRVKEFKDKVNNLLKNSSDSNLKSVEKITKKSTRLHQVLKNTNDEIHAALCNNIDIGSALKRLLILISCSNKYMSKYKRKNQIDQNLLKTILSFVIKTLSTFGLDFNTN